MTRNDQHTAIYVRVSSKQQDHASQLPDLERWADAFASESVKWYRDKFTGKTMDRPGWNRLEADMVAGKIARIVVWRLDRLGRTAAGLTALFEDLQRRGVGFESIRDKIDLSTAAGRLMANVLAIVPSKAQFAHADLIIQLPATLFGLPEVFQRRFGFDPGLLVARPLKRPDSRLGHVLGVEHHTHLP